MNTIHWGKAICSCLFFSLVSSMLIFAAPVFAEKYIELKYQPENLKPDEKNLIKLLREILLRQYQYRTPEKQKIITLDTASVDLNDDGVKEFLVTSYWAGHCGSSGDCFTSVYRRQETGFRYAGEISIYFTYFTLEENHNSGWRDTHSKEERKCWSEDPRIFGWKTPKDKLGFPYIPGDPGYFTWSLITHDCSNPARITMRAQLELNRVSGAELIIDGSYGPKTKRALDKLTPEQWKEFCSNLRKRQREAGEHE